MRHGFLSYAHDDYDYAKAFVDHLATSKGHGGADFWWDAAIAGGQNWSQEIADAINKAEVFVLLATSGFLKSDYIMKTERPAIEARARQCGGLIVSVILGYFVWEPHFGQYQVVPSEKGRVKPIRDFKPHDKGYNTAHRALLGAIKAHPWPVVTVHTP